MGRAARDWGPKDGEHATTQNIFVGVWEEAGVPPRFLDGGKL